MAKKLISPRQTKTARCGTWDVMTGWGAVLPPSRPAAWQLDIARQVLQACRPDDPVAVLGSTPEYRDLLVEMGFKNVYIFDKSPVFMRRMDEFRCYANEETFVRGDWLHTLPNYANTFRAILSDLTSGNVPYEAREMFYGLVSRALSAQGIFLDKVLTHPIPHDRLVDLEIEFARLPLNLDTLNRFSCKFLFCSELLDLTSEVDSSAFYEVLRERFTSPKLVALLEQSRVVTPLRCRWWYGAHWKSVRMPYFAHLRTIQRTNDLRHSPYARRCRLYLLIRR